MLAALATARPVHDVVAPQTYSQTVRMSGPSISYPHHQELVCSSSIAVADHQSSTEPRAESIAMATCYPAYDLSTPPQRTVPKDYSRPLHVDCSVEYELPNAAKPPQGVRNEPLLMIHPCYFRKIESQRRSPFINNLPTRTTTTTVAAAAMTAAAKRRPPRGHQPPPAAQYNPVQYTATAATPDTRQQQQQQQQQQLWESMPPLVPISQTYCKSRDQMGTYGGDSGLWTEPDRSPDRPEDKHILSGKYRQYLRAHRLHPYSAIPIASTFPQIQQVCYNV